MHNCPICGELLVNAYCTECYADVLEKLDDFAYIAHAVRHYARIGTDAESLSGMIRLAEDVIMEASILKFQFEDAPVIEVSV